jgi:hypothetical protein
VACSAADATGRLTVESTAYLFPGANAWVKKDTASARVKILAVLGATTILVRRWPTRKAQNDSELDHDQENYGTPNYGVSDMTDFDGGATVAMEAQVVPVDPAYMKRVLP